MSIQSSSRVPCSGVAGYHGEQTRHDSEKENISIDYPAADLCKMCLEMLAHVTDTVPKKIKGYLQWHGRHYLHLQEIHNSARNGCDLCRLALRRHQLGHPELAGCKMYLLRQMWICCELGKQASEKPSDDYDTRLPVGQWYHANAGPSSTRSTPGADEILVGVSVELLSPNSAGSGGFIVRAQNVEMGTSFNDHPYRDGSSKLRYQKCLCNHSRRQVKLNRADMLKERLRTCLEDPMHAPCQVGEDPSFRPPRLIDISGNLIRIIEGSMARKGERYATLSYCWGPSPTHLTLTTENEASLRNEIRAQRLPQTFLDAMEVAKLLGINYLWIDSLCILQAGPGSLENWDMHVNVMESIYGHGVVNLAAASSEDAQGGFDLSELHRAPPCITFALGPKRLPEKMILLPGQVLTRKAQDKHILTTRGWVFQERSFAPRVITFAEGEVLWECNMCYASPRAPCGISPRQIFDWRVSIRNQREDWCDYVRRYSSRQLTYPSDRLPALAGVAKRIGIVLKERYVAGFFEGDLPIRLLWYRVRQWCGDAEDTTPSWSWASIMNEVRFIKPEEELRKGEWMLLSEVTDVNVQPKNPTSPYGGLKHGSIVLRAVAIDCTLNDLDIIDKTLQVFPRNRPESNPGLRHISSASFDRHHTSSGIRTSDIAKTGLTLLYIGFITMPPDPPPQDPLGGYNVGYGLLLVRLENQTYRRVGMFRNGYLRAAPDGYSHMQRTVTIV